MKSLSILVLSLLLMACSHSPYDPELTWVYPPMAVPLQATPQQEVHIARLTQLLQRDNLTDELRAKILFDRGNYYDSVGLRELARLDFTQAIALSPAQSELFNLLGVYYTEAEDYDAAYEAFDASLELNPNNEYALRNRAIALYYGERYPLALEEMQVYYQLDPNDPFRLLWVYLIEYEQDPNAAYQKLWAHYQQKDEQWGWVLVGLMLDELSEEQAFKIILSGTRENGSLAQALTETYFYLAKRYQLQGEYAHAVSLYKLAIAFNVYEYVEHRYAFIELGRIYQQLREQEQQTIKN